MPQRLLAVGIDPAKHVHGVVAVLYPDRVVLEAQVPHDLQAMEALDARLEQLAVRHRAALVYGLEDHRQYGQAWIRVLQARGREVRVVNPLWTRRQKDFYGQDKTDLVDARAIAAAWLKRILFIAADAARRVDPQLAHVYRRARLRPGIVPAPQAGRDRLLPRGLAGSGEAEGGAAAKQGQALPAAHGPGGHRSSCLPDPRHPTAQPD
ncbi:transposase [Carboxydochorda subterranea]|uniref:Transposase n=1 Tax=Carboxydichorda subterranea TaxID=3109565 RepID=A0ABZ1BWW7_9FIRM|nr:transposase [Limnochorda sp. L945t]WRP17282.1 transposase [Limnochorda sp. L945t]